ncbi:6-phospho-beta-glucosidase [Vibrio albus]|uniref:6-phospho-beta-glucosidase n=1 Tax=Vibrio albus TaxID=2200953 RepID=A0A2U3B8T7_9VIBR|nr:6-phospho-beta-glucosidase [Vibrio albus]PWI33210.1 6-phospho-beta-glucosidase [Vibrio albus]
MDGYLKLTIVGGGSSYTPELIEGLLKRKNELPIKEIWLVDIEQGWKKVSIISALAKRMIKRAGADIDVFVSLDRRKAFEGADFICSQFRPGGLEGRLRDMQISSKYGMSGQETNGLGGFSNTGRTLPVMLEICRDIEQYCPKAWFINLTNPTGIMTEAILRYTSVKVIGLCNIPIIMERGINRLLKAEPGEALILLAGLNHFIFTRKVLLNGEDKHDQILDEILKGNEKLVPDNTPYLECSESLQESLGSIPTAYMRHYYMMDDIITREKIIRNKAVADEAGTCGESIQQLEKYLFDIYRDPNLDAKPDNLEALQGNYYSDAACELMASIYNDKRTIMHVTTRNCGAISGLPDNSAVEVSSVITKSGPLPLNVPPFPEDIMHQVLLMKEYESLMIEAAMTGNINVAHRALILNPVVTADELLQEALFETIEENIELMPQFSHLL